MLIAILIVLVVTVALVEYSPRASAVDFKRGEVSHALPFDNETAARFALQALQAQHPGKSGFHLITNGTLALSTRLAMIQSAEKTLDIQYYSMIKDITGKLLLQALLTAADRGVRVRLLFDALSIKKNDETWGLLSSHPHIEMRLFNPFATGEQSALTRACSLFTHFWRWTRRMHNKVFTADNQFCIIGGRNLGDAYFNSREDFNFRDMDVFIAGPMTAKISDNFDIFWNGPDAYPIQALHDYDKSRELHARIREQLHQHWVLLGEKNILPEIPRLITDIKTGKMPLIWAAAELAADLPAKLDEANPAAHSRPARMLERLASHAEKEFIAVSSYFVPGQAGLDWLQRICARGVKIHILTNSLGSTDVIAAHTGYRRYRKKLLALGLALFEMKPIAGRHPRTGRFANASRASLHSKVYVLDRKEVVIGTFNLDPRSVGLNTEMVIRIKSAELAQHVVTLFHKVTAPAFSFHVTWDDKNPNHIKWVTEDGGRQIVYRSEPRTNLPRAVAARLFNLLPFENQL